MRWPINYLHQCCREYRRQQKHYLFFLIFFARRWRHCLMLTINKLCLTPRPVTKLIKMYRSRLYQKRPTWLVYQKTSSLSEFNRYQSEKKLCILLARHGKLTEDGSWVPVLVPLLFEQSLSFLTIASTNKVFPIKNQERQVIFLCKTRGNWWWQIPKEENLTSRNDLDPVQTLTPDLRLIRYLHDRLLRGNCKCNFACRQKRVKHTNKQTDKHVHIRRRQISEKYRQTSF